MCAYVCELTFFFPGIPTNKWEKGYQISNCYTKDYNYVKAYIMTLINKLRPFSVCVCVGLSYLGWVNSKY